MRFLQTERSTLQRLLPGLDEALRSHSLGELERPGSPGLKAFRDAGGPALVVPADLDGAGATPLEALRVQRALGAVSPSLAVATTMHHFSVASLLSVSEYGGGMEWMLLQAVARDRLLLASGFAEGRPGGQILRPTMTGTPVPGGVRVNGVKKPCSLSRSMDLLTASLVLPGPDGTGEQLAIALIPARDPGVTVTEFWSTFALAGAESDEVRLIDVHVPDELIVRTDVADGEQLDDLQTAGFLWFELLLMGSYLGAVSALVQRVVDSDRVPAAEALRLVVTVEGAMAAAESIARRVGEDATSRDLLGDALLVRYAVQDAIASVAPRAVEAVGGLGFIGADDVGYLAAAVGALAFHPPARAKMAGPLMDWLGGKPLEIA